MPWNSNTIKTRFLRQNDQLNTVISATPTMVCNDDNHSLQNSEAYILPTYFCIGCFACLKCAR